MLLVSRNRSGSPWDSCSLWPCGLARRSAAGPWITLGWREDGCCLEPLVTSHCAVRSVEFCGSRALAAEASFRQTQDNSQEFSELRLLLGETRRTK